MNEKIRVYGTTMNADTAPVEVLYDEIDGGLTTIPNIETERFQILKISNGEFFLVIRESIYKNRDSEQAYKCFLWEKDAWAYLQLFGIEIDHTKDNAND